jgi:ankyrin repeat protein
VYSAEIKEHSSISETNIQPPNMDIFTAALFGDLKSVRQHIQAGTDLDEKDAYGSTPLIIAATFGKTEVAKALIEAGADVNVTNNDGATALHSAAFLCRTEIVVALLNNGADKNIKNNYGSTALESISGPFEEAKSIYDQFSKDLGPLGLKLDYEHIKVTRPLIADMLR